GGTRRRRQDIRRSRTTAARQPALGHAQRADHAAWRDPRHCLSPEMGSDPPRKLPPLGRRSAAVQRRRRAPMVLSACSPSGNGRSVNLEYENGRLSWPSGSARAAVGKAGVRAEKREGDGVTPAGSFPLLFGMYRSDRVGLPATMLPMTPLLERHAWVDDP